MQRIFVFFSITLGCLSVDQVLKLIARRYLSNMSAISICADVFRLQYAQNKGAFLSLGSNLPEAARFWLLIVTVGIILLFMLVYTLFNKSMCSGTLIAFSLIIGGGASNLMDRLMSDGKVIDFINIGIGNVRTGIFNLADVVILVGAVLLVIDRLRAERLVSHHNH